MIIRLGYVAISKTLEEISYNHTITYTHFLKLTKEEQINKLNQIIIQNLCNLEKILKYNVQNKIYFFRFSHNMIPLATHPEVNFDYITPYKKQWEKIGKYIQKHRLRIDSHPDQFCVLNSMNEEVICNSIKMLQFQLNIYKAMNIEAHTVIHIGSSQPSKEEALKRFKQTFLKLPEEIKKMIYLENDDKTFTALETLELCEELHIPMVLDYHHHLCNPSSIPLDNFLNRIFVTWERCNFPIKMHFSSPKSKKEFRAHHEIIKTKDFIKFIEFLKPYNQNIDIMLECKGKDESLFRLVRSLKFYTKYHFLNNTTFEL